METFQKSEEKKIKESVPIEKKKLILRQVNNFLKDIDYHRGESLIHHLQTYFTKITVDKIYEKIGNSQNKNSWNVKEFLNTNLEKEYKESYINNDFKDILVNAVYNIDNNDLITNEFKKDITTKLLK